MKGANKKQPEIHKKQLLEALERSLGIVTPACKEVGISRNQFYLYYKEDPEFKAAVDDINEITLDFVENQLLRKIKEGENQAIMFYMKYKARKRGYTEKIEIEGNMNHKITVIKLSGPDDKDIE
jgi:hypothetical protein